MKRIILCLSLFAFFGSQSQQINPVPDYVFSNKMSVGRNAVTDTAAYFSIGPRYGAVRGFMPPMVTDTAVITTGKRNGLTIFSIQKNKYMYWDSVRVQWSDFAGSSGAYIFATDTASMLSPYIRAAGNGLTKSGQSLLVDTASIATRARVQKAVDSINTNVALKVNISDTASMLTPYPRGAGAGNYMAEWLNSRRLDTANMYYANGRFAIGSTTTTNGVFNVIGGTTYLEGNLSFGAADRTISNISNNVLAFGTNNTERMRIGANGDMAIGTTNADPFARGDDRRIAMDASGISSTANVALSLNAGSSAGRGAQLYLGVGGTRHFEISSNSVEQGISAISNTYIKFLTNNTERMRLKADGEVLIGTTTDAGAYALQVAGSIYNTTGAVLAASSGNVGIGTASPSNILHVNGGSGLAFIRVSEAGTTRGFLGGANGIINGYTNEFAIRGESGLILSGQGNVVNAYINSSAGELIIANGNTDAGDYKLQVAGNIYNTGNITTGAPVGGTATSWRLGEVATVSPTSPNRTIRVEIGSQVLYIHAKTTND